MGENINASQSENQQEGKDKSFLTPVTQEAPQQQSGMVTTPCNHHFHDTCLKDWLRLKYECPYCRASLPAMPGDEE